MEEEYNFHQWTTEELFYFLIDMGIIPYEEELQNWIFLKEHMLELCIESYERRTN